jgi:hypothetical protein
MNLFGSNFRYKKCKALNITEGYTQGMKRGKKWGCLCGRDKKILPSVVLHHTPSHGNVIKETICQIGRG